MDELAYIARKLGKYLGGVDVEKAMRLMDDEEIHAIYVMRELKLDHMPPIGTRLSDADRLRIMLDHVNREIARYQSLIADAKNARCNTIKHTQTAKPTLQAKEEDKEVD